MTALGRGRPADAAADFRRAAELPLRRDSRDDAARHLSDQLLGFAVLGRCANAAPTSRQIAGWSVGGDKVGRAAVALALCGHAGDAIAMARKLAEARPKDTLVNGVWVPLIRGAAALRGQPSEAVELLQPALRYDFAYEASAYPDYVRGLAYLAQRDGKNALAEFKKILSHPYLYSTEAYYALSQLGAARAAALAGDTALSRRYYQQFFESWKNADPDLPQLAAAKNEFAELR